MKVQHVVQEKTETYDCKDINEAIVYIKCLDKGTIYVFDGYKTIPILVFNYIYTNHNKGMWVCAITQNILP